MEKPYHCRNRDPFQGPKGGFFLTLRSELPKKTHMLTKQETIGKGCPVGKQEGKGTQEDSMPFSSQSRALWW